MYDHIGLKVRNIAASIGFYEAALAPLGYVLCSRDEAGASFGPQGQPSLWLHSNRDAVAGSGVHVAFHAKDHAAVDRFHLDGLKAGGRDHGGPGLRTEYSPDYYAAFLFDPDDNNIEAVCMG
jgi:catechol 2,3-dioxygenase-like lactoylglutathione lyase family enzyme